MYFEFDKVRSQNWIVEGDYDNQFYYHFNFSATQPCSTTCLFFAEVIPDDGDSCDITCCKLLNDDDNGMFMILSNYAANCNMFYMMFDFFSFDSFPCNACKITGISCSLCHSCTGLLHIQKWQLKLATHIQLLRLCMSNLLR